MKRNTIKKKNIFPQQEGPLEEGRLVFFSVPKEEEEDGLFYPDSSYDKGFHQREDMDVARTPQGSVYENKFVERVGRPDSLARFPDRIGLKEDKRNNTILRKGRVARSRFALNDIRSPHLERSYFDQKKDEERRVSPEVTANLVSEFGHKRSVEQSADIPEHPSSFDFGRGTLVKDLPKEKNFKNAFEFYDTEKFSSPEERRHLFQGNQNIFSEDEELDNGGEIPFQIKRRWNVSSIFRDAFSQNYFRLLNSSGAYISLLGVFLFGFGMLSYVVRGVHLQGSVLGVSDKGMESAFFAVDALKKNNFSESSRKFEEASLFFQSASSEIFSWAGIFSEIRFPIPIVSKVVSGRNVLEAGEHLSLAGKYMSETVGMIAGMKGISIEEMSLLDIFQKNIGSLNQARDELILAQEYLDKVRLSDIPREKQARFMQLKKALPVFREGLDIMHENAPAFIDVLGGNGPRQYLFLFQNNQEARATGGFIGSYGLLEMKDGKKRKFLIDGVYNPDGQLRVDIVPPQPIRKVSAGWSLHDSNWFADFPTSAEKAISFYEKSGGATVSGVVTITPVVLQRLLELTGPIYLSEYDITVDSKNVIEMVQYKVEADYDKEENRPKKILGELASAVLDRVLQIREPEMAVSVIDILHSSLQEKHILMYSRNADLQRMYKELGWSGELKGTSNDFLSVVNSNINGYKTDGVIEQAIHHKAEIQDDGAIVDTVTVTRKHMGGDTPYEWWNAVNANYMRLYVPKGSQLLSVKGHTYEQMKDPLDYKALGFRRDSLVQEIEQSLQVDSESGTQIFEESGKTVFGNWVYVSPKESVTVEYVYALPFRIRKDFEQEEIPYSLLVQKQSGSTASAFSTSISFPGKWKIDWLFPSDARVQPGNVSFEGSLETDLFQGYVFSD